MNDILPTLRLVLELIRNARQLVAIRMVDRPEELRKLNSVALQLIAAAHAIATAIQRLEGDA